MIQFDKKHLILITLLFSFFLIAVFFKLHGYSFPMWRNVIDGSTPKEILLGDVRDIRADDYAVEIPMMIAQLSHDPKYPVVNKNIGTGLNMLVHSKVPIRNIITFFRPTVWGFFLSADYGLSWMWWTMVIGMFYIYFLVFMLISKNDFYLSIMGSAFLLFSSFFQFWSFHMAEIPIFMGLIFISFSYLCFSPKRKVILAHGVILGWALSCYAFNFVYPPYQISCAYLLLFMIIAIIAEHYNTYSMRENVLYRLMGFLIALIIFIYAVITYYNILKDIIEIMVNTVYPGQRFFTGGGYNFGIFFRDSFFLFLYIIHHSAIGGNTENIIKNICEAGSFWFFFPPIIIATVWQMISLRRSINKFIIIMMGYFIIFLLFIFFGFPSTLSKFSLFYMIMPDRSIIGLGIANVVVIVSFLSQHFSPTHSSQHDDTTHSFFKFKGSSQGVGPNRMKRIIISCLWLLFLCAVGKQLGKHFTSISTYYIVSISSITALFTYCLLNIELKKITITLLAGICFLSSFWFNPIVSGGTSFIYDNKLSKKILEINNRNNGNTNWATFGDWTLPNLLRMIGIKSINGVYPYPLFNLWEKVDPQRQAFSAYNRYCWVGFKASSVLNLRFSIPRRDFCLVYVNPSSDVLNKLGVTHILAVDEDTSFFKNKKFEKLYEYGNKTIFKLKD